MTPCRGKSPLSYGFPITEPPWDADGNLLSENAGGQIATYAWNAENRLNSMTSPDATVESYVYQEDGLRQKKVNGGGTTLFSWDDNLLLETDEGLVVQARYTDWPEYWGGLANLRLSGMSAFYAFDLQGSTRILVSALGVVTDRYTYRAFGEEVAATSNIANALRYVGQLGYYRDSVHREYVRARYLDVARGGWLGRDPLIDGVNWYTYAMSNPVVFTDPTGTRSRAGNVAACKRRKAAYCAKAAANPKNPGWQCICQFAGEICALIAHSPGPISGCLACINECMFNAWQTRWTGAWQQAYACCAEHHGHGYECCAATINADQDAAQRCAQACKKYYSACKVPKVIKILAIAQCCVDV